MRLSPRLVCRSTGSTFDASDQNNEGRVKRRLQRPPLTVGSLVTLTGKSFLGRGPGVPCLRKTSSFLARVLFYGPCARISGSGSPGSPDAAGAPGIHRENNAGPKTHVLGAPSVRALASTLLLPTALLSTLLLPTALLKGASVRSGSPMGLLLPGLS